MAKVSGDCQSKCGIVPVRAEDGREFQNESGKALSLEGILVDLASEAELIIDEWDYKEIVRGAIQGFSINAQSILRRISRRRFASRNTIILCDALFAEGIENDAVKKFYRQLKKKFGSLP